MNLYQNCLKRALDFSLVLIALLLIWPFLLIITIWLHFANKGAGAFFFQERPGKNGRIFKVIKFKTMTDERDANGILLPDAERLTKVGRFVRSTSIDELLQLINVLKGDMALIGPRPLLPQYLPLYNKEQARRHEVRPGITGWAQVHGRNAISWTKKFSSPIFTSPEIRTFGINELKFPKTVSCPNDMKQLSTLKSPKWTLQLNVHPNDIILPLPIKKLHLSKIITSGAIRFGNSINGLFIRSTINFIILG